MGYKLSNKAAEDIEKIWLYTFNNWSLEQADRYVKLIFDEFEYLAQHPLTGKDFNRIRKNYRRSKVKSHLIFYKIVQEQKIIEIIRVLHERMDIETRLND